MSRVALALPLAVLLAACSGSSDADGGSPDAGHVTTPDEACTTLAHSLCGKLAACNPFGLNARFGDAAGCEAREKAGCLNGLSAPDTSRTPSTELACAAARDAMSCEDVLASAVPDACQPVAGKRAAGALCYHHAQCASGYCGVGAGTCGTCMDAPGPGASCAQFACGKDLVCARDLCVRPAILNEPCDKDRPCDTRLSCVGGAAQATGHCQPVVTTVGAACDGKRQTGPDCDHRQGLFCVAGQCARATFTSAGQACGVVNGGVVACLSSANCDIPDGAKSGTCVAAAADGAACDRDNGPQCLPLARCVATAGGSTAGTCVVADQTTCP